MTPQSEGIQCCGDTPLFGFVVEGYLSLLKIKLHQVDSLYTGQFHAD